MNMAIWTYRSQIFFFYEEAKKNADYPSSGKFLRTISAEWRREHGLAFWPTKLSSYSIKTNGKYKGVGCHTNAQSLRKVLAFKRLHGILIWVDADPQIDIKEFIHALERRRMLKPLSNFY